MNVERQLDMAMIVDEGNYYRLPYNNIKMIYRTSGERNYNGDYTHLTCYGECKEAEQVIESKKGKVVELVWVFRDKEYMASVVGVLQHVTKKDNQFSFRVIEEESE